MPIMNESDWPFGMEIKARQRYADMVERIDHVVRRYRLVDVGWNIRVETAHGDPIRLDNDFKRSYGHGVAFYTVVVLRSDKPTGTPRTWESVYVIDIEDIVQKVEYVDRVVRMLYEHAALDIVHKNLRLTMGPELVP
jgi:hypothetical protein